MKPPEPHSMTVSKIIAFIVTILLLICLMTSCGVNRCIRVLERDGRLDTVTVSDTIRIDVPKVTVEERFKRDTLVEFLQGETIIRYRYTTKTDSIMIEADCPDQEVITTTKTVTVKEKPTWKDYWKVGLIAAVVGGIVTFLMIWKAR